MKDTITYLQYNSLLTLPWWGEKNAHSQQSDSAVDLQLEYKADLLTSPKMIENVCVC